MTNYKKLIDTLKEVFMLDKAELDFGIYRIMNQKRKDIEQFLEMDLVPQVKEILRTNQALDSEQIKRQIDNEIETAKKYGNSNPNDLPIVKELKAQYERAGDLTSVENEVFSLLANFFKRYFDNGDFISMRRYKKNVYAIPYEGEEVKLHWANADQYYIKTSEYFKVYRFKLANGKTVAFELIEASTEQNNNKTQGDKERRFALSNEELRIKNAEFGEEFVIPFTYEQTDKKVTQKDLLADALEKILPQISSKFPDFTDLLSLRPTEKDKQRTLLQKHLLDYTARNTFDYFIHKDLGGFLTRELDFYIKNEVLFIDDLNTRDEQEFLKQLSKIKAIKKIGEKIITFLAQLENFQKKLWLKKKMVVECNYCITLDRVPKDLYPEVLNNQAQIQEWIKLFAIDEIKAQESGGLFPENKVGFSNPLTLDFLIQNQFLVLDTAFFSETFKWKLIGSIEKFDEQCDGLLINSENFQALSLLQKRYEGQVKCTYIDPPYNTSASEIAYKNDYKHSSWLSLMENRLTISNNLLSDDGIICCTIDDFEHKNLALLMDQVFTDSVGTVSIRIKPSGRPIPNGFAVSHEYAMFYRKNPDTKITRLERDDIQLARYRETDDKSSFFWEMLRKAGSGSTNLDRPTMYFPFIVNKLTNKFRLPNLLFNSLRQEYDLLENCIENEILVYPIKDDGSLGRWYLGYEKIESMVNELNAVKQDNGNYFIYYRRRPNSGVQPTTVWIDPKYSASEHGTATLKKLFSEHELFSYPKSIHAVEDCLKVSGSDENTTFLDYFAGSATTAHAVINLNRDDLGNRKYILVEMGTYFDTVTKPRIQKVVYSKDWKDGKPLSREGISHCFKYMRLESYEDTLNNLALKQTETQQKALEMNPTFKEGYMLNYMLDVEAKDSLLNLEWFVNPFNCYLNITKNNELQPTKVDLVETFNYLIGLIVESYAVPKEGYVVVTGKNLAGESILVVWRDCTLHNSTALNQFLEKSKYNPLDSEYDRIYVNGDNNVENLKTGDERWKVVLIEEEFGKRMFENS